MYNELRWFYSVHLQPRGAYGASTVFLSGVRSFKNPASAQVPHMLAGVSRVGWLSTIFRSPSFPKLISNRLKLCQTSSSSPSTENT